MKDKKSLISRLNRIQGQVKAVSKMITSDRHEAELITQLRAIQAGVKAVESRLFQHRLEECMEQSFSGRNKEERERSKDELMKLYLRS